MIWQLGLHNIMGTQYFVWKNNQDKPASQEMFEGERSVVKNNNDEEAETLTQWLVRNVIQRSSQLLES